MNLTTPETKRFVRDLIEVFKICKGFENVYAFRSRKCHVAIAFDSINSFKIDLIDLCMV